MRYGSGFREARRLSVLIHHNWSYSYFSQSSPSPALYGVSFEILLQVLRYIPSQTRSLNLGFSRFKIAPQKPKDSTPYEIRNYQMQLVYQRNVAAMHALHMPFLLTGPDIGPASPFFNHRTDHEKVNLKLQASNGNTLCNSLPRSAVAPLTRWSSRLWGTEGWDGKKQDAIMSSQSQPWKEPHFMVVGGLQANEKARFRVDKRAFCNMLNLSQVVRGFFYGLNLKWQKQWKASSNHFHVFPRHVFSLPFLYYHFTPDVSRRKVKKTILSSLADLVTCSMLPRAWRQEFPPSLSGMGAEFSVHWTISAWESLGRQGRWEALSFHFPTLDFKPEKGIASMSEHGGGKKKTVLIFLASVIRDDLSNRLNCTPDAPDCGWVESPPRFLSDQAYRIAADPTFISLPLILFLDLSQPNMWNPRGTVTLSFYQHHRPLWVSKSEQKDIFFSITFKEVRFVLDNSFFLPPCPMTNYSVLLHALFQFTKPICQPWPRRFYFPVHTNEVGNLSLISKNRHYCRQRKPVVPSFISSLQIQDQDQPPSLAATTLKPADLGRIESLPF